MTLSHWGKLFLANCLKLHTQSNAFSLSEILKKILKVFINIVTFFSCVAIFDLELRCENI